MRPLALALVALLAAPLAQAQPELLFGSGKPPLFRAEEADQRFLRTRFARTLAAGALEPRCAPLVGGLLLLVSETGMQLHKRDENLYLDAHLAATLDTQLSTPAFPARAYYLAMVRQLLIERRLPAEWLAAAQQVAPAAPQLDLGKVAFLAAGLRPIDSFLFTLPMLRERYTVEVARATSAAADSAFASFRDTYVDREVAWGALVLEDVKVVRPKPPRRKRGAPPPEPEEPYRVAHLRWVPPREDTGSMELDFFRKKKGPPPVRLTARLAPQQYVQLERLPRGTRVLVRGRLWELNRGITSLELRDALLFLDPDWSRGVALATPELVAACPMAINDFMGTAPVQPSGFGHR